MTTGLDIFVAVVDVLILAGVWYEIYLMQNKRRRAQIKRTVTLALKRLSLT